MKLLTKASHVTLLVLSMLIWSTPVLSLTLDEAKRQGLVGEQRDGYLGIVIGSPSPDVHQLVTSINDKRRAKYREIANRNNTSLNSVESLAGQKAIEKTASGQYIQSDSDSWTKK
ncbi:MAG TPA: DUF1318 domain-containing protein [Gammaproteobacteria bacterium]|nr:DUF1318 domain-containing protein [Gammaproteobacteria bacterium]